MDKEEYGFEIPEGYVFDFGAGGLRRMTEEEKSHHLSDDNDSLSLSEFLEDDEGDFSTLEDILNGTEPSPEETIEFLMDETNSDFACLKRLVASDKYHAIRDCGLTGRQLLSIWRSTLVDSSWKSNTLMKLRESELYGVLMMPLAFDPSIVRNSVNHAEDGRSGFPPSRGRILKLLHEREYRELDALLENGKLNVSAKEWGEVFLQLVLLADYDWAVSDGNRFLRGGAEWIERMAPGAIAKSADAYGSNALLYVYARCIVSNPRYLARTADGIEMAQVDAEYLMGLGCDAGRRNVFDVSYAALRRWRT